MRSEGPPAAADTRRRFTRNRTQCVGRESRLKDTEQNNDAGGAPELETSLPAESQRSVMGRIGDVELSSVVATADTTDYRDPICRQPSAGSACTATCPSVSNSRVSSRAIL